MKKLFSAMLILLAALLFLLPASAKPSGTEGDWLARLETQYRTDNNRALPQYARDFYNWLYDAALGEGGALRQPTAGVGGVVAHKSNGTTILQHEVCSFSFTGTGMTEQAIHDEIGRRFNEHFAVISRVYEAFGLDYPECNWLNGKIKVGAKSGIQTVTEGEQVTITVNSTVCVDLLITDANGNVTYDIRTTANPDPDALMALVEQAVEDSGARTLSKWEDKIDAINNHLTRINGYCSAETFGPDQYDPDTALRGAYGPDGPVCEGYARAFKLMCDAVGIPCILVRGQAFHDDGQGEAHMWNQIKISDYWLGVDVTWNDPVVEGQAPAAVSGYERTTYLRAKYAVMQNHFPETNGFALPPILSITGNRANDATITQGDYTTPYEKIDDAITAFRDAADDAVLTICKSTTAKQDIELRGRQKLLTADNVTLTIDRYCKITVPGGADVELRGRFKSSSPDYIVHVRGTLKYSNTEIENSGGGVFLLEDGATLNQTGGGIKAKTFAVAICSPDARYNFTGGGINLADGYMSAVLFNIPENADNEPQMTINNSVYSPNSTYPEGRPLQVVVTWRDTLVPIIRYGTKNVPNVTAAPGTELIHYHDTDGRVFSACDNTADNLVAYIGSDNFSDISAALAALESAPDGATLVVFRGDTYEIDHSITLRGGKKILTQNGAVLSFADHKTITVPAGESAELSGEFKTDSNSCFIHVDGTLNVSGGRICNERGVAIRLHEGATLNQTGGDICTPKAAVELVHPSAHYNFTGGQINVDNGYAGYVYFNFQPDANDQLQMELSSGYYHSNTESQPTGKSLYIDVAWEDSAVPVIHYASSLRYPKIVARPGSDLTITINKGAKTFSATRNAGVATIDGQSYTTVEDAFAALEQMSGKTLNITKSTTTSRSLILSGGNKLRVQSGDLTFTDGATITVPAGQSGEINTGRYKTNSAGYLVHVYGTLKYSNTEIYNDNAEGGVFKLYDGATLNQTGGGINSPNVAVEIASPTARYDFTGGGININDKYAGCVFFNFTPDANNQPQMTINNSVYSTGRELRVKVAWTSAHVPVIAFGDKNIPNAVSVDPDVIGLDINPQTRIITAGKPETLTIPVLGDNTVLAGAAINGSTAQIKEMGEAQLDTLLGGGTNDTVSIDLSAAQSEIRAVDLPASLIDSIAADANTETLKIALKAGSVELDNGALQTVANTAPEGGANNVSIRLEPTQDSARTDQQNQALNGMNVTAAITVGLSVNNAAQVSDLAGGSATIRIPFDLAGASISDIAVWYISPSGQLELQSGVTYADGFLSWTVGHFSDYVVERSAGLTFAGKLIARPGATVTLTLSRTDGNRSYTLSIPADGHAQDFSLDCVHPGQYTLTITQPGALTVTFTGISLNSQSLALVEPVTLPIGDIDGDHDIDADDLAALRASNNYFQKVADGANPLCDLNGDGTVNVADAAILRSSANYGMTDYTVTLVPQG